MQSTSRRVISPCHKQIFWFRSWLKEGCRCFFKMEGDNFNRFTARPENDMGTQPFDRASKILSHDYSTQAWHSHNISMWLYAEIRQLMRPSTTVAIYWQLTKCSRFSHHSLPAYAQAVYTYHFIACRVVTHRQKGSEMTRLLPHKKNLRQQLHSVHSHPLSINSHHSTPHWFANHHINQPFWYTGHDNEVSSSCVT